MPARFGLAGADDEPRAVISIQVLRPSIGQGHAAMIAGLLPFVAFAFVVSAAPGPNDVLVLAAAASHGLLRAAGCASLLDWVSR